MANPIKETSIRPKDELVAATSRYLDSKVIYYGNNAVLTFKTYKRVKTTPKTGDRFGIVEPGQEFRPDLVSNAAYGTPDFWWKIMEANNIHDIFDFKAGINIRVPDNIYS